MVAADPYRPAAVKQLQTLGERIGVEVFYQRRFTVIDMGYDAEIANIFHFNGIIYGQRYKKNASTTYKTDVSTHFLLDH